MKTINRIKDLKDNNVLDSDSYKFSHWNQYCKNTSSMMSYFEFRGGEFSECTLFALKYLIHKYISKGITKKCIKQAKKFARKHGVPFNEAGWNHINDKYNGQFPVKIRGIPEGLVVPINNAILTIECNDPDCFWVVSWLETMLVRLWYPCTIAIQSRESKKVLKKYHELSSDEDISSIDFKLHDFGSRGVTCLEQSRLGSAAHLLSFKGTDTIEGARLANHYYHIDMAGFSIVASEHSTVSIWGRDKEFEMYKNFIETNLVNVDVPPGVPKIAACVSDTYNIYKAVEFWSSPKIVKKLNDCGGTLVIRPDSGDPLEVLPKIFEILETNLKDSIITNSKGFKVLPSCLRVIQGDGITRGSMENIIEKLISLGWSLDNIAFGSGGGLLQMVNRDTMKAAFKCCSAVVDGVTVDVRKDPITDSGKRSKAGRLDLIKDSDGNYKTIALDNGVDCHSDSVMITYFDCGDIYAEGDSTFEECRERMELQ